MAGQDPSDRFDYLLDPIAGETTTRTTDRPVVRHTASEPPRQRSLWLLAGATAAGAAVGLIVLWPKPNHAVAPSAPSPTPTTTSPSEVDRPAASTPEPAPPPSATTAVAPQPERTPAPQSVPPSASPPSTRPAPPSATVRAPISVSPAPRPAFPNQNPKTGGDLGPHGGLLGGGGLL